MIKQVFLKLKDPQRDRSNKSQAIVSAKNGETSADHEFLSGVYGILFFGVPNHGLKNEALSTMVKGQLTERLVIELGEESTYLDRLGGDFARVFDLRGSEIASFYETRATKTVQVIPLRPLIRLTAF